MSGGALNKLAGNVTMRFGEEVLRDATLIVQNSLDYAENSPVLSKYMEKVVESPTSSSLKRFLKKELKSSGWNMALRKLTR